MPGIPIRDIDRIIVYRAPPHIKSGFFGIKRASYPKGYFPPHLQKYKASLTGLNECPTYCFGKKGQSYRKCLIECAKDLDAFKEARAKKEEKLSQIAQKAKAIREKKEAAKKGAAGAT
ncbi:MAG: hypothetical protein QXQ95_08695 [Thermofilum sp.]|uniref:hypothetical protein n=1 Tax=Thermofilum sp. TaxID=1961369 RepID=UPI003180BC0E